MAKNQPLKPLRGFVFIKPSEKESYLFRKSNIAVKDDDSVYQYIEDELRQGVVIAASDPIHNINGQEIEPGVRSGDIILYNTYGPTIQVRGNSFEVLRAVFIVCIIGREEPESYNFNWNDL